MDRFLLAENPMIEPDKHRLYIFHTQHPPMLIRVAHEAVVSNEDKRMVFIGNNHNSDGLIETISLTIDALLICEPSVGEERIQNVLNKAWHWYVAYLKWDKRN